jgi:hypothetical protein
MKRVGGGRPDVIGRRPLGFGLVFATSRYSGSQRSVDDDVIAELDVWQKLADPVLGKLLDVKRGTLAIQYHAFGRKLDVELAQPAPRTSPNAGLQFLAKVGEVQHHESYSFLPLPRSLAAVAWILDVSCYNEAETAGSWLDCNYRANCKNAR